MIQKQLNLDEYFSWELDGDTQFRKLILHICNDFVKEGEKLIGNGELHVCRTCKKELPATTYYFQSSGNHKLHSQCKKCESGANYSWGRNANTEFNKNGQHYCNKCDRVLPLNIFYFNPTNGKCNQKTGFVSCCKECMRETSKFNLYSLNDCRLSFCIRDDHKVCHGCNVEFPDNDYYFFKKNNRDNGSTKCKKCRGFDYGVERPNKVYKGILPKGYKICCQCNKLITDEEYNKYSICEDCSRKKRKIYHQRDDVKKSKLKFAKKRRSLKNNTVHDLTNDEYAETLTYFNNSCAYCGISNEECLDKTGKSLEQEHIIPISKKGGYTKNNIIPSCKSCNNSKSNKDLGDFISRRIHKKKISFKNVCLIYYFINSNGLQDKI